MGRVMARAWAHAGISVNMLCPGYALTDINADWFATEPGRRHVASFPRRRLMQAADMDGTNGQVERMNRTIKEATVKRYHYDTHRQLETHLTDFIGAYNYAAPAQDAARPHTIRVHLQSLGPRPPALQHQPAPPINGTKHLASPSC